MKHFLLFLFAILCCCAPQAEPPNFLVLIADDAGWQNFGCYGDPYIATPHIDRLAESGIKANNAFLTASQCSPSRISILSGKYPHATGAEDLHMPLPENEKLLPSYLKEKGYFSGLLNKGHLGETGEQQFDYYSKNLDDFSTFLDSAKTDPFFMWVGFTDPHRPYQLGTIKNPQNPDSVLVPPYLVDDQATRRDLAQYYDEIRRMDKRIGSYIEILQARGMLDNTLIIFFSDNGAPFPRAKGTLYDAGTKTPLIFSWPTRLKQGLAYKPLLSVIDLAPTILEISGTDIPSGMQGKSIFNILLNPQLPGRNYVFSERNWHNIDEHMRSVRSAEYKLISNAYTEFPHGTPADISSSPSWKSLYALKEQGKLDAQQALLFQAPRPQYELYNVLQDPDEFTDLAGDSTYQAVYNELKSQLENWQQTTGDFPPEQRRRKNNTDHISGVKFDQTRLPERIK